MTLKLNNDISFVFLKNDNKLNNLDIHVAPNYVMKRVCKKKLARHSVCPKLFPIRVLIVY